MCPVEIQVTRHEHIFRTAFKYDKLYTLERYNQEQFQFLEQKPSMVGIFQSLNVRWVQQLKPDQKHQVRVGLACHDRY